MNAQSDLIIALQQFQSQQQSLTTGYLVMIDDQIHHFPNKKEWENQKETLLSQNLRCFSWTDLELWHKWKNPNFSSPNQ